MSLKVSSGDIFDSNSINMKKNILIFIALLGTLSLTAWGYLNWAQSASQYGEHICQPGPLCSSQVIIKPEPAINLRYDIDSRFTKMTRTKLNELRSIEDIFPYDPSSPIIKYNNIRVYANYLDKDHFEVGSTEIFNKAQLEVLSSAEYSTTVLITATCIRIKAYTEELENDSLFCYRTIVPEHEAQFTSGLDALLLYLRNNSKDKVSIIDENYVQKGKLYFTITRNGEISNIRVDATSGYPRIDNDFIELLANMPSKWQPAKNAFGVNIDQEFVFFFGAGAGC
ncbi:MAG: hypothetical protein ACI84C_001930 [Flavobacteriales bacterium]|jgi:hypothetical protein